MLDLLLSYQYLEEGFGSEVGVGGAEEKPAAVLEEEAGHVDVVVSEVSQNQLEEERVVIFTKIHFFFFELFFILWHEVCRKVKGHA